MKRRTLLRLFLGAPFVGLVKPRERFVRAIMCTPGSSMSTNVCVLRSGRIGHINTFTIYRSNLIA